ncbi:MAG: thioredoxin family protein [Geminicoccaceae bacterium]
MAFPMFATAAWLVWVLALQLGAAALLPVLRAWSCWAWACGCCALPGPAARPLRPGPRGRPRPRGLAGPPSRRLQRRGSRDRYRHGGLVDPDGPARPFDQAILDRLVADGRPVFVNMTAAWCITCLVNEETALSSQKAVEEAIASRGITYMKGDWTNADPAITAFSNTSDVPACRSTCSIRQRPNGPASPDPDRSIVLDALSQTAG